MVMGAFKKDYPTSFNIMSQIDLLVVVIDLAMEEALVPKEEKAQKSDPYKIWCICCVTSQKQI